MTTKTHNPADKVERWDITRLVPYARNSRTHSDEQISQLAASIKEWGWTTPVLVDEDGSIIAGHGRTLAAQRLKMTEVPVMVAKGWSDAKKRAYVLADNKLAMNAGWDNEMLALELGEIGDLGFDLDLTGFTADEIAALTPEQIEPGLTDEDEVPELPEQPVTVLGDVWVLGKHRLMCGDSTSIDAVDTLMAGQKADILFTDPPYGINFKPQRGTHDIILNDNLEGKEFDEFLDGTFAAALASMKPDTYAFIWTGWTKIGAFERSIQKFFKIQAMHVWVKNNFGIGYYSRPKHEPFYLCLNGKPVYPSTAPADVWDAARVHKTVHSCEKPVCLIEDILNTYHKNSVVLDLFGGSGSTLIACEKTNRQARLMELDPKYCDVIIKRWQDFTGKKATHAETGQTFDEVSNA
ncbi:putative methylase [uncultured Caudovirales phage]|uniref:Putative methylase n=1 Tax=uncultured Caudovirales phage TaxID=2100421 RepID=A0A6J5S4V7_9CAUD|nr:putative methylase [uncultured Caudovirales phage]